MVTSCLGHFGRRAALFNYPTLNIYSQQRIIIMVFAAGRLCLWSHTTGDRRQDDDFRDFRIFRNSLRLRCDQEGDPGFLKISPNISWPDVVYYNSFTHRNTGNKIVIVDSFPEALRSRSAGVGLGFSWRLVFLLCFFEVLCS